MSREWHPMYWGDYLKHTQNLSTHQHGIYLLLLSHYYATGDAPLNDPDSLARITRCISEAERDGIQVVLRQFFKLKRGRWHNARADYEIRKAKQFSKKQSENARKRWDATAMPPHIPETSPHARATATATSKKERERGNGPVDKSQPLQALIDQTMPHWDSVSEHTPAPRVPTLLECKEHWKERMWKSDPDTFHDHYEGHGWPKGRWTSVAANWERREHKPRIDPKTNRPKPPNMNDDQAMMAAAKKYKLGTMGKTKFDLHAEITAAMRREET